MHLFKRVLVGVGRPESDDDGQLVCDAASRAAIDQAIALARHVSCQLCFVSVTDPAPVGLLTTDEENEEYHHQLLAKTREDLDQLVNNFDLEGISYEIRVVEGLAWEQICRCVSGGAFDLVIIGTRPTGRLRRLLFGGTGLKLLRNCPSPVWIVKPTDPNKDHQAVLVATQLDDVGVRSLSIGVDAAHVLDAELHILHALDLGLERRIGLSSEAMDKHRQSRHDEKLNQLQEQLAQTDYRTTPYGVSTHIAAGRPYVSILEAIEEYQIDLLIMGTAARGGLPGVILGNTAESLLSDVSCSILVLKPTDFVCPIDFEDQA